MEKEKNYFTNLSAVNVNDKTETKGGLTYLSWAYAWGELKKRYPDSTYTVYEREDPTYGPINYFTDGVTCWVKTGVTVNGIEHIEMLPVMNARNQSISAQAVTSTDVNKAIQRCLTKAIARHGLGLYIYAGEDLPDVDEVSETTGTASEAPKTASTAAKSAGTGNSPSDAKKPLQTLISEIGKMTKDLYAKTGNMDKYKTILAEVTGDANFKCSKATEGDYDVLTAIHSRLAAEG